MAFFLSGNAGRAVVTLLLGCVFSTAMPAQNNWRWIGVSYPNGGFFGPAEAGGQYSAWAGGQCTNEEITKNLDSTSPRVGWSCTNGTWAWATVSNAGYQDTWFDGYVHAYLQGWDSLTTFAPWQTVITLTNNWNTANEYHCNGPASGYISGPIYVADIGGTSAPCPEYPNYQ